MIKSIKLQDDIYFNGEIFDMGNNENGTYIKWANGLMICFGIKNCRANTYQKFNDCLYYGYIANVSDFPEKYKNPPIVHFSVHSSGAVFTLQPYNTSSITTTKTGGVYPIAPGVTDINIDISYMAIGFWK